MTTTTTTVATQQQAFKTLEDVKHGMVAYAEADADTKTKINTLLEELDVSDTHSIISFGSGAQQKLTSISDSMLSDVKNKDAGEAGVVLNEMVAVMRGFDVEGLDPNKKRGFFAWLMGKSKPMAKFVQRYESVRKQIDSISGNLESHKTKLLTDVVSLDRLYEANLEFFHDLELYIAAGEEKITRLNTTELPELKKEAELSNEVLDMQQYRDLSSRRDDLERRVHDLRLTRQVTMQSLPSIRLLQENDKALVTKIDSAMVNTIPLWRQQLAQSVAIYRSGEAAKSVRAAGDLTNELLEKNAENLKQANAEVRQEIERGIVDIESVKKANTLLIETIQDSLRIAEEGKLKRKEALVQLQTAESDLKSALMSAQVKSST